MNIFRVGGAVRDRLLGYPHHETDWVVVGSTPDEMIKNGFTQVVETSRIPASRVQRGIRAGAH